MRMTMTYSSRKDPLPPPKPLPIRPLTAHNLSHSEPRRQRVYDKTR